MPRNTAMFQLWLFLIAINFLAHGFEDGDAVVYECDLGKDLETNRSFIENNTRSKEGLYLITEGAQCEGRVALLDFCGLFPNELHTASHFFAAIYRPVNFNESRGFERITSPVHFDIDPTDLLADSRKTCTLLRVFDNWYIQVGDVIGFSFTKDCVTETLELGNLYRTIQTGPVCPVYSALATNNTNDSVYYSKNLSTDSLYLKMEDLSVMEELKINAKAIVELLPPLYSEVCANHSFGSPPNQQASKSPEGEYFTGGGTYVLNHTVSCRGRVSSLSYCGRLNSKGQPESGPPSEYFFTLLHLRRGSDGFDVQDREYVIYSNDSSVDNESTSINVTCRSHTLADPFRVREGDQFAVIIGAQCYQGYCPIQVAVVDSECDAVSLFEPNYYDYYKPSIEMSNTSMVAVKVDVEINVDFRSTCFPEPTNEFTITPYIVYIVLGILLIITVSLITLSIVLIMKLKHSKPQQYKNAVERIQRGSRRIRESFRASIRRRDGIEEIQGVRNRSFREENDYSFSGNHGVGTALAESYTGNDGVSTRTRRLFIRHELSALSGSYSSPIDAIRQSQNTGQKQYCDPPSEERDLKQQIKNLEVKKDCIVLQEYLGSGQFGVVYHGLLRSSDSEADSEVRDVAVKTMEGGANEEDRIKFLQEAAIMGQFDNPYIIQIFGVHTSSQPYMIICELMKKGDLRRHLHSYKLSEPQNLDDLGKILLGFSRQIANAMVYLTDKGFVHRDLAARNILVSVDGVCKIADFGLSRSLQDENYYVSHGGPVPVRWTAPEAIQQWKYSTASDVWSFGIVLYEIWSLALKPYRNFTNEQVLCEVFKGYRLAPPPGCPRLVYAVMISCWHPDPASRATFSTLKTALNKPDSTMLTWSEEDSSMYSGSARTIGGAFEEGETLYNSLQLTYSTNHE